MWEFQRARSIQILVLDEYILCVIQTSIFIAEERENEEEDGEAKWEQQVRCRRRNGDSSERRVYEKRSRKVNKFE